MIKKFDFLFKQGAATTLSFAALLASAQSQQLSVLGKLSIDAAEIIDFNPVTDVAYVTSSAGLQTVDLSNPTAPALSSVISGGSDITSTAVGVGTNQGLVAIAVKAAVKTDNGTVELYDTAGVLQNTLIVGPNPDMVVFSPDGSKILVANEGESSGDENEANAAINPNGSISIIDLSAGVASASVNTVDFTDSSITFASLKAKGVRTDTSAPSAAADLEPEYIAISPEGTTAFVTLQENNAVAVMNINSPAITINSIQAMGLKDHSLAGNELDASNRDSGINIQNWPVFGMYMPDSIASLEHNGTTYYLTANEGDGRDIDETRIKDYGLIDATVGNIDPTIAASLPANFQDDANLGRIKTSNIDGDTDGDGDIDQLHVFGGRSFSIYNKNGTQVYDSGADFENESAKLGLPIFNDDDGRSDDKGPEPEGITLGTVASRTYAFIGIERTGGVMVYDVTNPLSPTFEEYFIIPDEEAPEGLKFIAASESPSGQNLLLVTHEKSGNLTVLDFNPEISLQLLHASDLEGGVDAIDNAKNFAAIVKSLEEEAANTGLASILLSAGDNYIPGPFFSASGDRGAFRDSGVFNDAYNTLFGTTAYNGLREGVGRVDISIMNILGFDASAVGNHEFDQGSDAFGSIIEQDFRSPAGPVSDRWVGAQFPYLSANLDFSADSSLSGLHTSSILPNTDFTSGSVASSAEATGIPKIAGATTIDIGGETIGVLGATTQLLESISSPSSTVIGTKSNDMNALAAILQPVVDDLINGSDDIVGTADDLNKIILVSHLQQFALEQQLSSLLDGVDIIVAGGSDTLLAQVDDQLRSGDIRNADYPYLGTDMNGAPVAVVSTDGQYSYVGRLVVDFDSAGELITTSITSASGAYATDETGVLATTGEASIADAISNSLKATEVEKLTDAAASVVTTKDGTIVGHSTVFIEGRREFVRTEETNMGNLTADANLDYAQSIDATVTVSIKNGGGIRAEIGSINGTSGALLPTLANPPASKDAGDISQLDIENSLRFNNGLTLLTVTAEELERILEHAVASSGAGSTPGQFPQISGVQFSFDSSKSAIVFNSDGSIATEGERIRSLTIVDDMGSTTDIISIGGDIVGDPNREIRIVTLDFLWGLFSSDPFFGGDGYPFKGYGDNVVQLKNETIPDGASTFSQTGGEQDALAEYFLGNFPSSLSPYEDVDTTATNDERIQNVDSRTDTVIGDLSFATYSSIYGENPAIPSANDDNDLLSLAEEYFYGLNPNANDARPLSSDSDNLLQRGVENLIIEETASGRNTFLQFLRRKNFAAEGLSYTPQYSHDMSSWTDLVTTPTIIDSDGEVDLIEVQFPALTPLMEEPRYFRMKLEPLTP